MVQILKKKPDHDRVKDGYLNLLLHYKNVLKRGWVGRKKWLKKTDRVFFSVSYLIRFLIVVQLLHSIQTLPDGSDKLGLVSITFQTMPERAKLQLKNGWHNKLRNRSTSPKLRKTVSIPEVILQSTFSRTVISLSKQKRMNAHSHNSATSHFDDEMSGAFYS